MPPPKRRARAAPAVEIGSARPSDLLALARLGAKLAREHHGMDPERFFLPEEPIEEGYARWLGKELSNPRAVVLAARATVGGRASGRRKPPRGERATGGRSGSAPPGEIVGYAYGRIEPRDWNTLRDRCGVGVDLWVEPSARGAGIGARLVEALADALAVRGAERVVLDVAARNPRAARLFARMGFRPTLLELTRETPRRGMAPRRRGARAGRAGR